MSGQPVVGVIVTHNSQDFLPELLASINNQTRPLDQLIVIDDNSTDATKELLTKNGITPIRATTTVTDVTTRIAHNFQQGINAAPPNSIVILGDHDDTWRPNRVQHQVDYLTNNPEVAMLASDGWVNSVETLRTYFPIPSNWNQLSTNQQFRYALRHSIATGGASAIRPSQLGSDIRVPAGWLHDRWWSLAATAQGRMALDDEIVIDYRITTEQQVGLDTAMQQESTSKWLAHKASNAKHSAVKARDVMKLAIRARR